MTWADCFGCAAEYDVTVADVREALADHRGDD